MLSNQVCRVKAFNKIVNSYAFLTSGSNYDQRLDALRRFDHQLPVSS